MIYKINNTTTWKLMYSFNFNALITRGVITISFYHEKNFGKVKWWKMGKICIRLK
jgi:hypothetical protein